VRIETSSALKGKLIGALSYGSTDNQTNFFATPISLMRATFSSASTLKTVGNQKSLPATLSFKGHQFKRLSTPVYFTGLPSVVLNQMKARAPKSNLIQSMTPMPVVASNFSASPSQESGVKATTVSTDNTSPFANSTIMTFLVHGDVFFDGATGSVTASDGNGWGSWRLAVWFSWEGRRKFVNTTELSVVRIRLF
jgi:hypothetical protein